MSKFKRILVLALAVVFALSACGRSGGLDPYDPDKDPVVKAYKIGDEGDYKVTRLQCLYATKELKVPLRFT